MSKTVDKLAAEIHGLPDIAKLRLVDAILADLDKPDPEIDRVWAEEARSPGRPIKPASPRRYPMRPLWRSIIAREGKFMGSMFEVLQ